MRFVLTTKYKFTSAPTKWGLGWRLGDNLPFCHALRRKGSKKLVKRVKNVVTKINNNYCSTSDIHLIKYCIHSNHHFTSRILLTQLYLM